MNIVKNRGNCLIRNYLFKILNSALANYQKFILSFLLKFLTKIYLKFKKLKLLFFLKNSFL